MSHDFVRGKSVAEICLYVLLLFFVLLLSLGGTKHKIRLSDLAVWKLPNLTAYNLPHSPLLTSVSLSYTVFCTEETIFSSAIFLIESYLLQYNYTHFNFF